VSGAGRALAVEFLGLPGVGKSAVCAKTAEHLSRRGFVVRQPVLAVSDRSALGPRLRGYLGKSRLIARELLAHPLHSLRSIRAIASTRQPSPSVLVMVVTNWLMQGSLLRTCRSLPAVSLFEEGIFQALWSIGLEGRPGAVRDLGATLADVLSVPDVVVVVEADLDAVIQRLGKRAGNESRADRWRGEDDRAFARASAVMLEVTDSLTRAIEREQRSRVIRVDNRSGADPEAAARQLALQIEQLWLSEAPPARIAGSARTTA
jgi:thymidylate kinase